jgi:hypothetical protein
VLVVVVVRELGCGAFPIFVDVARRPAHFLWCVGSVRWRQSCSLVLGCAKRCVARLKISGAINLD